VVVYSAYLLVTAPLLVRRLKGWPRRRAGAAADDPGAGTSHFSLGRWGLPINILAVGYGLLMAINIAWPRAAVYDPVGGHWYLRWFPELFLAGVAVLGAAAYAVRSRQRAGETAMVLGGTPALEGAALEGAE
jgi:hypothetical protein